MSAENEEIVKLFQSIGLSEQKAKETLKNTNVTKNLKLAISEVSNITITGESIILKYLIFKDY